MGGAHSQADGSTCARAAPHLLLCRLKKKALQAAYDLAIKRKMVQPPHSCLSWSPKRRLLRGPL